MLNENITPADPGPLAGHNWRLLRRVFKLQYFRCSESCLLSYVCLVCIMHVTSLHPIPFQMLLEKLNGTVPCLLDTTTIPAEELTMKTSRSCANSGIGEGMAVSNVRAANGESALHPYHRTFSPHFHHFVEQCLQRNSDFRYSCNRNAWLHLCPEHHLGLGYWNYWLCVV